MEAFAVGYDGVAGSLALATPFTWWPAAAGIPDPASPAEFGNRNAHGVLNFDDTVEEGVIFVGTAPAGLSTRGLVVTIETLAATAVIGSVVWSASIERIELAVTDTDSDAFGPAWTTEVAVAGTSGVTSKATVSFSIGEASGLLPGDPFRILIKRKVGDARDDLVGDAQVLRVFVEESATVLISKTAATILAALLLSWHDPSNAGSVTLNGSDIAQLDDLSGNGHHVAQVTPARQPALAAGALNGLDAGLYDTTSNTVLSVPSAVATALYAWVVFRTTSVVDSQIMFSISDGSDSSSDFLEQQLRGVEAGDPVRWFSFGTSTPSVATTTAFSAGVTHVARSLEASPTSRGIALDGTGSATDSTNSSQTGLNTTSIGDRFHSAGTGLGMKGHVGEVVSADPSITPQQISDMDVLMAFKWGAAAP
ncbi:MAG: hypothetical protein KAJ19_18365 [Gammaproteobacteria bacterium]|nr:hypothetical protein [Gammaproteobacteria bacterium]